MYTPRFLAQFDSLAKTAHLTGNNKEFAEKSISFFIDPAIGRKNSSQLACRLELAEDRFRDNKQPLTTEENVADTFNSLRSGLYDNQVFEPVTPNEVHILRNNMARYSPNLFLTDKEYFSPVELLVPLFLIIYNNGAIHGIKDYPDESIESGHTTMMLTGTLMEKSNTPTLFESIQSKAHLMSKQKNMSWLTKPFNSYKFDPQDK